MTHNTMVCPSGVTHAQRRGGKLEKSAEAVADAGVDPVMARAVVARLRWNGSLGLEGKLNGIEPPDYRAAIDAIQASIAVR